jgi:hypothetical protein
MTRSQTRRLRVRGFVNRRDPIANVAKDCKYWPDLGAGDHMCSEHSSGRVKLLNKVAMLGVVQEVIGLVPLASPTPSDTSPHGYPGIPVVSWSHG